jgi:hypothetical protein
MHATSTTPLRERMRQELQLAGLSERTQEAYPAPAARWASTSASQPTEVTGRSKLHGARLRDTGVPSWSPPDLLPDRSIERRGSVTQTRVRVRARGAVGGTRVGLLEHLIAGPAARPAIHILLGGGRPASHRSVKAHRWWGGAGL